MLPLLLAAAVCVHGDLAQGRPVSGEGLHGVSKVVTQSWVIDEGTAWDTRDAVKIDRGGYAEVDLGDVYGVAALILQADNDDEYLVEGSADGARFTPLWVAEADHTGPGLRTRHAPLRRASDARYLRIRPREGDGNYSVSRLRVLCYVPPEWKYEWTRKLSPLYWWRALNNDSMVGFKGVIALLGSLLLLWGALLEWKRKADSFKRTRDALLAVLAIIACFSWFNLLHFHFDGFVHDWEFFHYYLGGKYQSELGYTRLYECTTAAELQVAEERGTRGELDGRLIRNLTTNHLESAQPILDDPKLCTDHFTPDRWRQFVADVMYFRGRYSKEKWNDVIHDHGYNGTPVWSLLGRALASGNHATEQSIHNLALLDPILLGIMWCFALWAFGWRATAVAMLWWGTNLPARYLWNGGAYLRMDWLAAAAIGVCLVKKEKHALGGAALTFSALLRIFPGFIVVGLVAKAAVELIRTRTIRPEIRRFIIGCVAAMAILLPASIAVSGTGAWPGFVANSKKHLATALTNNMGWKTVVAWQDSSRVTLAHDPGASDPFGRWKETRLRVFEQRKLIFYAGVLIFLGLLAWSTRLQPDWIALALGVGLIPVAAELTCYYYSVFLIVGFLWLRRRSIGVLLLLLSAASCFWQLRLGMEDEAFHWISIATVLLAAFACVAIGLGPAGEAPEALPAIAAAEPAGRKKGKRKR